MNYKNLLFDLDGTLTDPMVGITSAVRYALAHFGIAVNDPKDLCPFIGPPLEDSFREFYGFSPERAREAVAAYRQYFEAKGIFENEAYPGIVSFLQELQRDGFSLMLATSKPEPYARRILEHFRLDGYFHFVGGATFDSSRSAKADVVRYVLQRGGVEDPGCAVMIGDRRHDVEGARENGLEAIGVLWGYGSREELSSAGASALASDLDELSALLRG